MKEKTYILSFTLFVFYFASTNSYVVRAPDANITEKTQNNYEDTEEPIETTTIENNDECGTKNPGYTFSETTKSCYKVHTDGATWDDAAATCVREGGHLAVINSQDEADFLVELLPQGRDLAFIGFHWNKLDKILGSWVTIQGQTLGKAGYRKWRPYQPEQPPPPPLEVMFWDVVEPTDYYGACGALFHLGILKSAPCGDREAFICEKDPNTQIQSDPKTEVPIEDTTETVSVDQPEPCQASPCGPNSLCRNINGLSVCSCLVGFTGYPPSCRAECTVSSDCLPDEACSSNRTCIKPCPEACGVQALCQVKNHIPICSCPISYSGNPFLRCVTTQKEQTPVQEPVTQIQSVTTTQVPIDDTTETVVQPEPCQPSPCGPNSKCSIINGYPECSCLVGFTGHPPSCRAKCTVNSDCLPDEACSNRICIKPCPEVCGVQALCQVRNHIPICSCPISYSGNPFVRCVSSVSTPKEQTPVQEPVNPCYPSLSCGRNAMCMEYLGMPKCACIPGFVGSPPHCKPECRSNSECPAHQACINQKCADPCATCGVNTQCRVINHSPSCACLSGFTGNPFDGCVQEVACSINTDCPSHKSCLQNKCQDPCPSTCAPSDFCHVTNHSAHCAPYDPSPSACQPSPCGPNSRCQDVNQQAHCFCLPNYIGSPPRCRPECNTSSECSKDKACIDQKCQNPCPNFCGINSDCRVNNHILECQCKPQYTGDPISGCSPIPRHDDTTEDEESSGMEDLPETALDNEAHNECGTMDTEYTFYKSTHSCYKVHTDRATWDYAEATCVREGGHLAVINSQDEADTLTTLYPEGAEHVFVGFSYRERNSPKISNMYEFREDGVWLTIDGQTLSEAGYENWTPGEPNNAGGREYCGTIYGNGKFDDAACYEKFDFICEIQPNLL